VRRFLLGKNVLALPGMGTCKISLRIGVQLRPNESGGRSPVEMSRRAAKKLTLTPRACFSSGPSHAPAIQALLRKELQRKRALRFRFPPLGKNIRKIASKVVERGVDE
jgi:hypothetical protein